MIRNDYEKIEKEIINVLEEIKYGVLATANKKGTVSASQVCLVNNNLKVYVQTDKNFEKSINIKENPNVAINCGAYYFKGIAKIIGSPISNNMFIEKLKIKHPRTYILYTNLSNEILIEITLTECKIWDFKIENDDNSKTIATINLENQKIELKKANTCKI